MAKQFHWAYGIFSSRGIVTSILYKPNRSLRSDESSKVISSDTSFYKLLRILFK